MPWLPADQWKLEVGLAGLFSSLPVRSWGNGTDGEERTIDRIKATLPDAELALRAMGAVGGREGEKAVHQHVC